MRARSVAFVGALWLTGCGTNRPEIPPELLGQSGCQANDYPNGPYGGEPGELVKNMCFQGFRAPDASQARSRAASLDSVAFSNFYDPEGTTYELLLVNSSAIWCSACRIEHETLPQHQTELGPHGLVVLSALFQDAKSNPAVTDDLVVWVETFQPNFPMVLDPDYQLGAFASAETAPLNLVVDARTMRIVEKFIGDQSSVLWPFIENELSQRE
ncbi:MAG TPA: hypothetical protein VGP93_11600 [Polyangiaceae bacterium]|jgi:hypothetical protein|nr:hypothetical protein [Polyangiaceae bacterium]